MLEVLCALNAAGSAQTPHVGMPPTRGTKPSASVEKRNSAFSQDTAVKIAHAERKSMPRGLASILAIELDQLAAAALNPNLRDALAVALNLNVHFPVRLPRDPMG